MIYKIGENHADLSKLEHVSKIEPDWENIKNYMFTYSINGFTWNSPRNKSLGTIIQMHSDLLDAWKLYKESK